MATVKTEIINVQIDQQIREATAEEIQTINAQRAEVVAAQEAEAAKTAARASALAKLAELGLTEEEIAAL